MATRDIQPPRQHTALDDEIAEAEREVRRLKLWRSIMWGAIIGWLVVEICLILIAVITHYKNWVPAPWIWGIGVPIGVLICVVGPLAIEGGENNPFARSRYIAAVTQLDRLRIKKRERSIGRPKNKQTMFERYKESMPELVERYRIVANHYRRIYNSLQAFIIIGALSASTLAGAFESVKWARWAAVGLTAAVGISSAIGSHFKLSERSTEMQKTADLIEVEFRAVEFGIGDYDELTHDEA
jgi:Protein of unknown function (DUF4231)